MAHQQKNFCYLVTKSRTTSETLSSGSDGGGLFGIKKIKNNEGKRKSKNICRKSLKIYGT